MKKRIIATMMVLATATLLAIGWYSGHRKPDPETLLKRSDLSDTSVSYSWTGGFSLGNFDVHARFSGNGEASLQVGDDKLIRTKITQQRYRELIRSLADNGFNDIKVKRRWGAYLCDVGKHEVTLRDGAKKTTIYADQKHYVSPPELVEPILDTIYSFKTEFGQPLDYGPIASTCISDHREIMVAIIAMSCCVIGIGAGFIWMRTRKRRSHSRRSCFSIWHFRQMLIHL